ncbi:conserved hypothetical protein [Rippkaea orientalis PCC 8801]|uniref:Uncharacterized protein n=1 Tax=Rippkaea orientalis (strain PCC 8801 / RF-1) TaxID=41431 RepID=B7JUU2_RIPO1|nr:conserved hypothetical protein [Rippkaea orientalis PCC 8801]
MKTDTIFYRLFQFFLDFFFELIKESSSQARNYRFSSVEVKQLSFRLDGVFLPSNENTEQPIYFTEVQFQAYPRFYARFFAEIFLYLSQTDLMLDWKGVILYSSRRVEPKNTKKQCLA